jgi:hypothetical protein
VSRRRRTSPATMRKLRQQLWDEARERKYRRIIAADFVQRCRRRPVPEQCVADLHNLRCYPRRESDGSWSALDTPRTRALLASHESRHQH